MHGPTSIVVIMQGNISFDANGGRLIDTVRLFQYKYNGEHNWSSLPTEIWFSERCSFFCASFVRKYSRIHQSMGWWHLSISLVLRNHSHACACMRRVGSGDTTAPAPLSLRTKFSECCSFLSWKTSVQVLQLLVVVVASCPWSVPENGRVSLSPWRQSLWPSFNLVCSVFLSTNRQCKPFHKGRKIHWTSISHSFIL